MINKILKNDLYEICIKDNFFHLINYLNIIDINSNNINILLKDKKICINGSELMISAMDEYEIIIKGKINSVQFKDR